MLKLFKNRNYALLFTGNLVSQIGSAFYNFGISWFILSYTESTFQAGLYLGFSGLMQVVLVPFLSVYADRWHKGRILVFTDWIRGLSIILAGGILWAFEASWIVLTTLYVTALIIAVNQALFAPAVSAIIPEIVPDEDLQQAYSLNSFVGSIQQLAGVLLAGILYAVLGIVGIFLVNGLSFIVSGISELWIRLDDHVKPAKSDFKQYLKELQEGVLYLKERRGLMGLLLLIILLNFSIAPVFSNIHPFLFNLVLNQSPVHLAGVSVLFSVGAIAGGISVGTLGLSVTIKRSMRGGLIITYALFIVHHVLIGLIFYQTISYAFFYLSFLTVAFWLACVNMWINVPFNTGLTRIIDPPMRGRVMGLIATVAQGLIPLSMLITGALLEFTPLPGVLGLFTVIGFLPFLVFVRSKDVNRLLDSLKNAPT